MNTTWNEAKKEKIYIKAKSEGPQNCALVDACT